MRAERLGLQRPFRDDGCTWRGSVTGTWALRGAVRQAGQPVMIRLQKLEEDSNVNAVSTGAAPKG